MTSSNSTANASVNARMGLFGWLTLVFVILKLNPGGHLTSPVVDWSWWLVFSPMLVGLSILVALLLFAGAAFGVAGLIDRRNKKRRQKAFQERFNRNLR